MPISKAAQISDEIATQNGHGDPTYYYSEILQKARDETLTEDVRKALTVIDHIASFHFKFGET